MRHLTLSIGLISIAFITANNAFAQKNEKASFKNTIDCELNIGAIVSVPPNSKSGADFSAEISKDTLKVTFTDLSSDEPRLVGNMGSTPLKKIDQDKQIYLLEITGGGNLNVWTYFPKSKSVTLSKQYSFVTPYSMLLAGKCQER